MSDLLVESDEALAYTAPDTMPVRVLAVSMGEAVAVPDVVETVDITWQHLRRPGVFVLTVYRVGDWRRTADRYWPGEVLRIEELYDLLGGWPDRTPMPTELPPGGLFTAE